jgi:hypothetical protein
MDDEPTINWEKKLDKDENNESRTLAMSRKNVGNFENERWELPEGTLGASRKERWELPEGTLGAS